MITILLALYALSIVGACNFLHVAYSDKGIWYVLEGTLLETIIIAACPIVNSFFALGWLFDEPLRKN